MKIWSQLKRALFITKKDLSIYYFRGPVIIQGLLIPAFLFLSFSVKRGMDIESLFPGLVGMALFFAVSAITPVIAPWETRMRTFEKLVSSPIYLWAILLGDIIGSVIFGLIITSFVFLAGVLLIGPHIFNLYLFLGTVLAAFCFSALGTLISAPPADKPSDIMLSATVIKFLFLFVSGVFIPLEQMSSLRFLSFASPLTYYVDLVRYSAQGTTSFSPFLDILILSCFTVVLFLLSVIWHKKSLDRRF